MADGRVRWGVLSAAKIAREWVVPGIHMSDRGELAAVASLTPGKAEALAAPYGGVRLHTSYEALLADPEVDAIYIPLPNHAARRMDGEMPRGRQARALREADRAQGRGDRRADRAPRPHRPPRRRGLHGHASPAVDPRPRAGRRGRDRPAPPGAGRLHLLQRRPGQHPQPRRHRRRGAARHRRLSLDLHPLRHRRGADRGAATPRSSGTAASTPPLGSWRSSRASAWTSTSRCAWRRGRS